MPDASTPAERCSLASGEPLATTKRRAFVYIVECTGGALYCGFAFDVVVRLAAHQAGRGARFTRSRRPVRLRWIWEARRPEDARRLEGLIKLLSRAQKLRLLANDPRILGPLLIEVARRRRAHGEQPTRLSS